MTFLRKTTIFLPHFFTNLPHIFQNNPQKIVRLKNTSVNTKEFLAPQVGNKFKQSVGALFEKWRQEFERNLISEPQESIEHILAHCLGTTRVNINFEG